VDTATGPAIGRRIRVMADPTIANQNAPVSAVGLVQAFVLVLAAFVTMTDVQITAINGFLSVLAAFAAQRYHTLPRTAPTL
jgi:hypothetical protein